MSPSVIAPPPPRADLDEGTYAELRAALARNGYSEAAVLRRLGLEALPDVFEGGFHESVPLEIRDGLDALICTFLLGRGTPRAALAELLGEPFVAACLAQELLRLAGADARAYATVSIQPSLPESGGAWIVSDRVIPAPEALLPAFGGMVYPTVAPSARAFLQFLPRNSCNRFLEVCAGCGPAAVLAGEFAASVTACDIDARAVAFCRYNARLNEIDGFQSNQASLYEGLGGGYDVIAAHPPFMPSDGPAEIFYGGGPDGTDLLRQLITELPGRLTRGGIFYAVAMIPEGDSCTVEERVSQWLGKGATGHDVFFFPLHSRSLVEVAYEATSKLGRGMGAASRYRKSLLEMGHREFHYGALLVRRHGGGEEPIRVRRKLSPRTGWRELLWCVDWETRRKDPGRLAAMMGAPLAAAPALEVLIRHRPGAEGLEPASFAAMTHYPFEMESQLQGWMAMLLGEARDGRDGHALFQLAKDAGWIHPETPSPEFVRLIATFVSGGFLESETCPLPTSPAREEAE